jgi:hypothetical protein
MYTKSRVFEHQEPARLQYPGVDSGTKQQHSSLVHQLDHAECFQFQLQPFSTTISSHYQYLHRYCTNRENVELESQFSHI